jgi:iron complex transport system ATP-binding protein
MIISLSKTAVLVSFREPMRMASSASVRGGLVTSRAIVNLRTTSTQTFRRSPEELIERYARRKRLGPGVVGLLTAAPLEYTQFVLKDEGGIKVLALVTAGASNALNVSERTPVSHSGGEFSKPGTINTILVTNAEIADECMISTVITATEAKTAALLDLRIMSVATGGQATGTGTDAVVVVSGKGTPIRYAGGHTLYGQLVGEAVHAAVSRALLKRRQDPAVLKDMFAAFDI